MKILLAALMCMVLNASQCFAIDGGPWGGGGSHVVVTGTYAGVLVPIPTVLAPGPPPVTTTDNSLVLFTMKVPSTGLATGSAIVFRNGFSYFGRIDGSADPDSAILSGVVTTAFLVISSISSGGTGGTSVTISHEYDANGQFNHAKIVNTSSSVTARIRGKASLTYVNDNNDPAGDSGGAIVYKIRGFKQSQSST